jgi:hypothetical protein
VVLRVIRADRPAMPVSRGDNEDMICEACRERRHRECRGGTWCDCQHKPPTGEAAEERSAEPEDGPEPGVNWLRQG